MLCVAPGAESRAAPAGSARRGRLCGNPWGAPKGLPTLRSADHGHAIELAQVLAVPGSATAPGPGRSPAPSTVASNVGGMVKTLTRDADEADGTIVIPLPMALMVRLLP